jgi:hypothetical protein
MKYLKYFEAKVIPFKTIYSSKPSDIDRGINFDKLEPLKDSDTIIVYHGFYSHQDAEIALTKGLSGQEIARRVYSFESGNNKRGLFVSIDFNTVKRFARSGVIIEFATKVSDLESPMWVGGKFFKQGDYTKSFTDWNHETGTSNQREEERLRKREEAKNSKYDFIKSSDRPELAQSLYLEAEHQALFVGNLNPNMIRAVWYNPKNRYDDKWERLSPNNFIKYKKIKKDKFNYPNREYLPNDEFTIEDFRKRCIEYSNNADEGEELFQSYLKAYLKERYASRYELKQMGFFPKQIEEILRLRKEGEFQKWIK